MMVVQVEAEVAAQNFVADEAGSVRLFEGLLTALVAIPDFPVDVVITTPAAHRVGGDHHAFDQHVWVVAQDVAVLEGSGLAFVGIAHEVLVAGELLRHEAPFEPGGEAGTATPA